MLKEKKKKKKSFECKDASNVLRNNDMVVKRSGLMLGGSMRTWQRRKETYESVEVSYSAVSLWYVPAVWYVR